MSTTVRSISIVAVILAIVAGAWWWSSTPASTEDGLTRRKSWPRLPREVVVEVLNGGQVQGVARDAALRLRRAGLDVVYWGNASTQQRDTTALLPRILVRSGDTTGIGRIGEVLGEVEVIDQPDPRRLVDLTIIIRRR